MSMPLEGIRVLDWTQWQMGTVATAMLADFGAEVIHIEERLHGDAARGVLKARGITMALPGGRNIYFETNNRGKKGIAIDLTKSGAKEVIYRLVAKSDVFVHNFRQTVPPRLGLDYETLSKYNPKLIYAACSGFGPKGPESAEPALDFLGLARSGIMAMVGEPDMPPLGMAGGISDQMGGIMTGYGILLALLARERLGVGQKVDVSHLGSMIALQGGSISWLLYSGKEPEKDSRAKAANALWNYYKCADGKWLVLSMLQEKFWAPFCRALGVQQLEKDPRFDTLDKRTANAGDLVSILDGIFITKSSKEWVCFLKEKEDILCTPLQTLSDLLNDPQVLANEYITDVKHKVLGPIKVVGVPIQLSGTPGAVRAEAPSFGEHTEEVLLDVGGYSWGEIAHLQEAEVI